MGSKALNNNNNKKPKQQFYPARTGYRRHRQLKIELYTGGLKRILSWTPFSIKSTPNTT
jgi:hypothetical protein